MSVSKSQIKRQHLLKCKNHNTEGRLILKKCYIYRCLLKTRLGFVSNNENSTFSRL